MCVVYVCCVTYIVCVWCDLGACRVCLWCMVCRKGAKCVFGVQSVCEARVRCVSSLPYQVQWSWRQIDVLIGCSSRLNLSADHPITRPHHGRYFYLMSAGVLNDSANVC